jgi:hypothetical protein
MLDIPEAISEGVFMIRNASDNEIYAVAGWNGNRGFYRYSISGNTWTGSNVPNQSSVPVVVGAGSNMIRNGSDDQIYTISGNNSTGFQKYSISGNSWTALTAVPSTVGNGSTMLRNSSDNDIYVTLGGVSWLFISILFLVILGQHLPRHRTL